MQWGGIVIAFTSEIFKSLNNSFRIRRTWTDEGDQGWLSRSIH